MTEISMLPINKQAPMNMASLPAVPSAFTGQLRLACLSALLAFVVVMLGAYVRLSNAGLGCPDWPGCYGFLSVPTESADITGANQIFPDRPVEAAKAWKEMIHRYLAGTLGLMIALLAFLAWKNRRHQDQPTALPGLLLATVIFQALLGMWTVTLLVKPLVVTAHLLGGITTVALLWLLFLRLLSVRSGAESVYRDFADGAVAVSPIFKFALGGLIILILQIFLGGWTSTNYAALGCIEFPTCYGGRWWPEMDFSEGFVLWRGLGVDYEYGVLEADARAAIHITHRIGAGITAIYLGCLAISLLKADRPAWVRRGAAVLLALLLIQISLGVSNVLASLPLPVAVAHNGIAALLVVTMVSLLWMLKRRNPLIQ